MKVNCERILIRAASELASCVGVCQMSNLEERGQPRLTCESGVCVPVCVCISLQLLYFIYVYMYMCVHMLTKSSSRVTEQNALASDRSLFCFSICSVSVQLLQSSRSVGESAEPLFKLRLIAQIKRRADHITSRRSAIIHNTYI